MVTWMTHIALPFVTVWFFSCGFHFVWARVSHLCQSELRADSSTDKQQLPFNFSQAVSRLVRDLTLQFITRFDLTKPMTRLDMTWHNVVTWLDLTCQQKRRLGTCLRLGTNWLETYLGLGSEGLEQWSGYYLIKHHKPEMFTSNFFQVQVKSSSHWAKSKSSLKSFDSETWQVSSLFVASHKSSHQVRMQLN